MKNNKIPKHILALFLAIANQDTAKSEIIDIFPLKQESTRIEIHSNSKSESLVFLNGSGARSTFYELESYPLQSPIIESPDGQSLIFLIGSKSSGTWPIFFRFEHGKYTQVTPFGDNSDIFPHLKNARKAGVTKWSEKFPVNHLYCRISKWISNRKLVLRITGDGSLEDFGIIVDLNSKEISYVAEDRLPEKDIAGYRLVTAFTSYAGAGTGFFVSNKGHIATCAHVIDGAQRVRVDFAGAAYEASPTGYDAQNDLDLLQINISTTTPYLSLSDSSSIKLGLKCMTVGFPQTSIQGFSAKLTEGSISSRNGFEDNPHSFQISAPIQPGNSGGALISESGDVLGVIESKLNALNVAKQTGDLPQNVNYAIKSNKLSELMEKHKIPKHPNIPAKSREDAINKLELATVRLIIYK